VCTELWCLVRGSLCWLRACPALCAKLGWAPSVCSGSRGWGAIGRAVLSESSLLVCLGGPCSRCGSIPVVCGCSTLTEGSPEVRQGAVLLCGDHGPLLLCRESFSVGSEIVDLIVVKPGRGREIFASTRTGALFECTPARSRPMQSRASSFPPDLCQIDPILSMHEPRHDALNHPSACTASPLAAD
jgi:hypothetical protein